MPREGKKPTRWKPLMPRIMAKTKPDSNGCWVWQGYTTKTGYASINWQGKSWLIHRAVYTELVGPIPENLEIDHTCENKSCCNPHHLEVVTHHENMLRSQHNPAAINAQKTHCIHGHEFTEENTITRWQKRDQCWARWCRTCQREWYHKNKAKAEEAA